jgi:very-long-chain enoyl-CoA reductase
MHPRLHNTLSYSVAAASLPAVLAWLEPNEFWSVPTAFWVFHFVRRTAESLWVHRYSGRSVPWADALIEYAYYWGFGIWIGMAWASGNRDLPSEWLQGLGLGIALVGEAGNAWAHLVLRGLRARSGSSERVLPNSGLFRWVDCPHYSFEILSWVGFALMTGLLASLVFAVAVVGILGWYASQRHARYLEEFDGKDGRPAYPASRRALVPGLF